MRYAMLHRIVSCLCIPAPVGRSSTCSARYAGFCYVTCSPGRQSCPALMTSLPLFLRLLVVTRRGRVTAVLRGRVLGNLHIVEVAPVAPGSIDIAGATLVGARWSCHM
ncbi:hypothetical protein E2C01_059156 [Portunus trituberculatus]|uniref:Uncharacterized protein n=1 Tax=Portunus trituberculatus TaxID=210409 RepID=A0A5B7H1S5_PORTR|nr:hypothetical protein [Portunus trituberculatus]